MDDTLVGTRDKWLGAIREYLSLQDIPREGAEIAPYLGKNCRDICLELDARWGHIEAGGIDRHAEIFRRCLVGQFARGMPPEIPGASAFLSYMSVYVGQYVVSGSPLRVVASVVEEMGWSRFIADRVSSESVEKGKPDPRIYDELRRKLDAEREECLIFEDSPAGIEAARRAGIRCVGINVRMPVGESDALIRKVPDFRPLLIGDAFRELFGSELRQKPH